MTRHDGRSPEGSPVGLRIFVSTCGSLADSHLLMGLEYRILSVLNTLILQHENSFWRPALNTEWDGLAKSGQSHLLAFRLRWRLRPTDKRLNRMVRTCIDGSGAESGCFRSCDVRTSDHGGSPSAGRLSQSVSMTTTGDETTGDGGLAAHRDSGDGVMNDLVSPIVAGRGLVNVRVLVVRAHPGEQGEPGDVLVTREPTGQRWMISNMRFFYPKS